MEKLLKRLKVTICNCFEQKSTENNNEETPLNPEQVASTLEKEKQDEKKEEEKDGTTVKNDKNEEDVKKEIGQIDGSTIISLLLDEVFRQDVERTRQAF